MEICKHNTIIITICNYVDYVIVIIFRKSGREATRNVLPQLTTFTTYFTTTTISATTTTATTCIISKTTTTTITTLSLIHI